MNKTILAVILLLSACLPGQSVSGKACDPWSGWNDLSTVPLTERHAFFSPTIGATWSFLSYLPPGYETSTERYPVLYWLHGGGGTQTTGATFVSMLDAAIAEGRAPKMIVILVQGPPYGWWIDASYPGTIAPVETAIVDDLIPHVDASFRTLRTREGRGIEGFSMGGCGSARLAFTYPGVFGLVSVLAGGLQDETYIRTLDDGDVFRCAYGDSSPTFQDNWPRNLAATNGPLIEGRTHVRIAVGTADDKTYSWNLDLADELSGLGIANTLQVCDGVGHDYPSLYSAMDRSGVDAFQIFRDAWGNLLPPPENEAPMADAGRDRAVRKGRTVRLNGAGSSDPNGDVLSISWVQIQGPAAPLSNPGIARPALTVPDVPGGTLLTYRLTVSDGALSDTDTVEITVVP
jgi:endo-1,4-beta-xylanase